MDLIKIGKGLLTLSGISIITFLLGAFIINSTLIEYSLTDFNLVKPRAISVGVTFIFFLSLNLIFYMFSFGVEEFVSFNSDLMLKRNYFNVIFKVLYYTLILAIIFFQIFEEDGACGDPLYQARLFDHRIELEDYIWIPIVHFLISVFGFSHFMSFRRRYKLLEFFRNLFFASATVWALVYTFTFFHNYTFNSMLGFEAILGIIFSMVYTVVKIIHYLDQPRFHKNRPDVSIGSPRIFIYSVLVFIMLYVIGIINLYATTIYPEISQMYGGGKLERMTYVTKTGNVSGLKLHETEKYIFLINSDRSISKIDWDEIIQIKK